MDGPGAVHHVMVRGVDRRSIFLDDRDRRNLLRRFARILPESSCACFAWALMPNHMHLVLRTGEVEIGRVMARVGTGYAGYFNRRHGRVGHLVQNRFKSRIVSNNADLQNLIRYVHLNPVSARIVGSLGSLEHFPWSGHAALMGASPQPFHDWVETLLFFGKDLRTARSWLREFMRAGLSETGEDPADPGSVLRRMVVEICEGQGVDPVDLKRGRRDREVSKARRTIVERASRELIASNVSIAKAVGVSDAAVHHLLHRRRRGRR